MKKLFVFAGFVASSLLSTHLYAQSGGGDVAQGKNSKSSNSNPATNNLYLDMHHLGAGKVNAKGVAEAHAKDLAVQKKYGVQFLKYWLDEANGTVYCLVSSPDSASISRAHGEAHGLIPDQVFQVTDGKEAKAKGKNDYYLDLHELGAGHVTAKDVAGAHLKDLAVQKKYGVNLLNYWVDEKEGRVVCLAQAPDSSALVKTHAEAHGLLPVYVVKVKEGK